MSSDVYVLKHKGIQSTVSGLVWFGSVVPQSSLREGTVGGGGGGDERWANEYIYEG